MAQNETPGILRVYLRDGSCVEVPLQSVEPVDKKRDPKVACDFSGLADEFGNKLHCDWCRGEAGNKGMISGGFVRFFRIIDKPKGIWDSAVGACPKCVFGGWRKARQKVEWSDSIPGVPNLSDNQWDLLDVWRRPGDGYREAVERLSTGSRDAILESLNAGGEG